MQVNGACDLNACLGTMRRLLGILLACHVETLVETIGKMMDLAQAHFRILLPADGQPIPLSAFQEKYLWFY
jgi:hypothetical protein